MDENNSQVISENIDQTTGQEDPKNDKDKKPRVSKGRKAAAQRTFLIVFAIGMVILGLTIAGFRVFTLQPYAVTIDGKDICYIKDDEEAREVMENVLGGLIPEDSDLKLVKASDGFKISKAGRVTKGDAQIMKPEEAADAIRSALAESEGEGLEITTVSTREEVHDFTPEIKYEKDETMLAGQSEVVAEGKKGKEERLRSYTCVNGEVVDENTLKTTVLDEGKSQVIKKGVLGLPDGEDWTTYEGSPVFNSGGDLVTTSMNYLGAPYKYGGASLVHGIDCVQFVRQMYKKYGISLPNGHKGLQNVGIGVSLADAQPGDIVCYSKHVAIYAGDGKIVEAVPKKGVRVGKVNTKRLVTIRRVVGN